MSVTTLRMTALDTLFFRESRPQEALGGAELASVFPPPPRTVLGAIRTAIGEAMGADWARFPYPDRHTDTERRVREIIGIGDDLGQLRLDGLWLSTAGQRLYPAPLWLLQKRDSTTNAYARLRIGAAVTCQRGKVRLPELPPGHAGFSSIDNTWLTATGMEKVLYGGLPDAADILEARQLFALEPRLGIARDNQRRTAEDGLLYQTQHIRPCPELAIEADLQGLDATHLSQRLIRLGAEGRLAGMGIHDKPSPLPCPTPDENTRGMILTLLTSAHFQNSQGHPEWLPSGFKPAIEAGVDVWRGDILGVPLTLHAAVIGKPGREGGWDMAAHRPRPAQSLIPAGSAWYCTIAGSADLAAAMKRLHGQAIGLGTEIGRGRLACGTWNIPEYPND